MPCVTACDIIRGRKVPGILLQHRHICGIAGGQQSERADGFPAIKIFAPPIGFEPLRKTLGGVGHDRGGLGTIVGRSVRESTHDGQGDGDISDGSRTPALESENALAGLGLAYRPAEALARVAGEERHGTLARAHTEDHVVDGHHSGGWRAVGYGGHQNLVGSKRRDIIMIHGRRPGVINPSAHSAGPQIPGPGAAHFGDLTRRGEVRRGASGPQRAWQS